MEFGATGADDMKDVTSELTIGDIINNVIDAIKSNPDISVVDAFKQALDQQDLSDDDVDYFDDKEPADDDVDYESGQDYQTNLEKDDDIPDAGSVDDDNESNTIKNNPLNQNPTQVAQRTDGSLMGYRRLG